MFIRSKIILTIVLTLLVTNTFVFARSKQQSELNNKLSKTKADLVQATKEYKTSLEKLLVFYEADVSRAAEQAEKRQKLFSEGIISKRDLEESERVAAETKTKLAELKKQLSEADDMIAEAEAPEELLKVFPSGNGSYSVSNALIRYTGSTKWVIKDAVKVESFFSEKFGRPLPISAYGQTV